MCRVHALTNDFGQQGAPIGLFLTNVAAIGFHNGASNCSGGILSRVQAYSRPPCRAKLPAGRGQKRAAEPHDDLILVHQRLD